MQIDESKLFPPEPTAAGPRRPSDRPATRVEHRALIVAIAGAAALGGALAGASPAGTAVVDVVLSAGFAAVVTLAGSRARRATWLWVSGVATIAAPNLVLAAFGLGATSLALAAHLLDRRSRVEGALVAAVSVQVLLRLGGVGFFGASAVLALLATAPLLVSAYRVSPRRVRRRIHLALIVATTVVVVGLVSFLAASAVAAPDLDEGTQRAREGLEAIRHGDDVAATAHLEAATDALERSHAAMTSWWSRPALVLPVVGHQMHAAEVGTAEGRDLVAVAAEASRRVPAEALEFDDGKLDLELVRAAQGPLEETADVLEGAGQRLAEADTPWVLAPFDTRLRQLRAEVAEAAPDARMAADVAAIAPAVLGGGGTRRYFVIFTTPAETRGLGGFMGNWAELTAEEGKVTLTRSGRTQELRDASPATDRTISAVVDGRQDQRIIDYLDRYATSNPTDAIQDVTLSPDLPTVAEVMRQLYPQVGGTSLDGVLLVDPYALEALMRFTGPVQLEGLTQPLRPRNAAEFLLVDQYALPDQDDRVDLLEEASREVFERLTTGDLPNPREVADALSPVVDQGRLALVSFHPEEQAVFSGLGISAQMPLPSPVDGFSLVTSNGAQNKIDVYLQRRVHYVSEVDPETGEVAATATVELTNDVPSLDLPDAVVGSNDQDLPRGTNEVLFSFYSPLRLEAGTVDGAAAGFGVGRELGHWVYTTRVQIPPGGKAEVELALAGTVAPFDTYQLSYIPQPTVNPDEVSLEVRVLGGWSLDAADGAVLDAEATRALVMLEPDRDQVVTLDLRADGRTSGRGDRG